MIYKFKSKAAGDVIMLAPNGDEVLRLIGKEPAPQGIVEVADLPHAISALESAVHSSEAGHAHAPSGDDERPEAVGLRQRAWPLVEMMKESLAGNAPIVWGV